MINGFNWKMKQQEEKHLKDQENKARQSARTKAPKRTKLASTSKIRELTEEREKLSNELDEIKDRYLRTVAEFENYKKRRSKEIADIIERANEQFCLDMLPVIDDFERSLNSEMKRKSYKSLMQGIELIYQKFLSVLKKQGVEPIASVNQQFNPEWHEAIMQIEDNEKPANIVVNEALKGYRLKDKVLRYSQVVVNK